MTDSMIAVGGEIQESSWYVLDERGLSCTRVPSWEEWSSGLEGLATLQHALPMIIGDYLLVGEDTFGERYEQAIDVFGSYAYGTVANYKSIMKSVPRERRREGLTMAHYKAIRSLEPDEQDEWQDKAVSHNWNGIELWDNIHDGNPTFIRAINSILDDVALLYSLAHSAAEEEFIGLAQQNLQYAREDRLEQERDTQAQITG